MIGFLKDLIDRLLDIIKLFINSIIIDGIKTAWSTSLGRIGIIIAIIAVIIAIIIGITYKTINKKMKKH